MDKQIETIINYIQSNINFVFLENYELYLPKLLKRIHKANIFNDILYVGDDSNLSKDRYEILTSDLNDSNYLGSQIIKSKSKDNVLIIAIGFDNIFSEMNKQYKTFIELLYKTAIENMHSSENEGEDKRLTIIFSGTNYTVPKELRDFSIKYNKSNPTLKEIESLITKFKLKHLPTSFFAEQLKNNMLSNNLQGLSDKQIIQTLSILYLKFGPKLFDSQDVKIYFEIEEEIKEIKKQQIEKTDIISIVNVDVDLENSVKGLNNLRKYIYKQKRAFENSLYLSKNDITLPKGVLLLGKPGNGKSLSAKAIANTLGLPLIKFEISKILGQYVGQSESKMQETLSTIQSMSPCVLWIDEIEKAFSGTNNKDNDVMRKVIGIFLTWMSDENKGVFVVATANNVKDQIPSELTRKGRFDKIFYINNPNFEAKKEIFKLHVSKRLNKMLDNNANIYSSSTYQNALDNIYITLKNKDFSGAEIEYCCNEGIKTTVLSLMNLNNNFDKEKLIKKTLQSINRELDVMIPDSNKNGERLTDLIETFNEKYREEIETINSYLVEDENKSQNEVYSINREFIDNLSNIISKNINKEINTYISEKENKNNFESAD